MQQLALDEVWRHLPIAFVCLLGSFDNRSAFIFVTHRGVQIWALFATTCVCYRLNLSILLILSVTV